MEVRPEPHTSGRPACLESSHSRRFVFDSVRMSFPRFLPQGNRKAPIEEGRVRRPLLPSYPCQVVSKAASLAGWIFLVNNGHRTSAALGGHGYGEM